MNGGRILSLVSCLSIAVLFGCTDDNIEGAAKTTSGAFSLTKTSNSFTSVNNGSCGAGTGTNYRQGTEFLVTIEYTGNESITGIRLVYTSYNGSTAGTPVNQTLSNWEDSRAGSGDGGSSGSLGTFRGVSSSGTPTVKIRPCINFGTSTSIKFDYTITTTTNSIQKTYTTTTTINKPTGAN